VSSHLISTYGAIPFTCWSRMCDVCSD